MTKTKKIHKFEIDDWEGNAQYGFLLCLDPENYNTKRKYESSTRSAEVTCKKCLKKLGLYE